MHSKALRYSVIGDNSFDAERVHADFPALQRQVHGKPLAYLDTAASAQKPQVVIDAMAALMQGDYANIHRGVYHNSQRSTDLFEGARARVAKFINAKSADEIVFTRNTTEAINLVAASWGRTFLKQGDEVLITEAEHHANIVPWQLLQSEIDIRLTVAPVDDTGALDLDRFRSLITPHTKLVAVTHMSNALGAIMPVQQVIEMAHAQGIPVLLDGSQSIVHMPIDVQALNCDFFAFTGHKLYGPTGIGVLYGKYALLDSMPPYQGGGDMIERVSFEKTTFRRPPARFEAGTPAFVEAVGLAAAIDYLEGLGREAIAAHEADLHAYLIARLTAIEGLCLYGTTPHQAALASFTLAGVHAHDIGTIVDSTHNVAIRVGHHCAQPLMDRFGVAATARASLGIYSTRADIDTLADALGEVREMFA